MAIETSILISALAGFGSFLSPCILPIIPGFLSYLSGASIREATSNGVGDNYNVQGNNQVNRNPIGGSSNNQVLFISKKKLE